MLTKYKKIIIVVLISVIAFFVYSFFFGANKDDSLIKSVANTPSGADVIGSEIIQSLNQIETLQLDRSIFEDPVYRSLVDHSQPIPKEPVGRDNPFSPITIRVTDDTVVNIPKATTTTNTAVKKPGVN
jgi:hypothetical protein